MQRPTRTGQAVLVFYVCSQSAPVRWALLPPQLTDENPEAPEAKTASAN